MVASSPSKILIGISLDADESKELLNWAIKFLAHPGDTIVAMHVIVAKPNKKHKDAREEDSMKKQSIKKYPKQIRQSKSFVISITGEFFKTCQSNEVNLEARVGLSCSPGRGLIEETKSMGADYLIIGGKKKHQTNRLSQTISKYCCEHVPDGCSFVLLRRTEKMQHDFHSNSIHFHEFDHESSCEISEKNYCIENSFSSLENEISKERNCKKQSPRTVLNICEGHSAESNTDEDSPKSMETCCTDTSHFAPEWKNKPELMKPSSPLRIISSFFRLSCDWSMRKHNGAFYSKENHKHLLRCFSYEEIASATNNFHIEKMVGKGGYSEVYKGDIGNGCSIAVKRLAKDNSNADKEKEFLIELGIIGHVNHPNTAKLVGYCIENGLYLIFQFYPNGTLSTALHGPKRQCLSWPIRYRICIGIARGLHYLHKCCKHRIIHRDIKASNVLLGPNYQPQISDFGLAKWLPSKWTHHAATPIEGTFGYLAPEYFMHGIVDEKTDVFSFGILLLEIITGRRPVDSNQQNLLLWAKPLMESGNLSELADPKLEGRYDVDQFFRVTLTAAHCVRQSSILRPSMNEVLQLLTYGQDSTATRSRRIPKFTSDELDDYSMVFGYELPSALALDDISQEF